MEHVTVAGIGTAVPAFRLKQEEALNRLKDALQPNPDAVRWANRIFTNCGVDTRYTCEPNLLENADRCRYAAASPGPDTPSTEERMAVYRNESAALATEAARKALADSRTHPGDITHLIAASCTGMYLPGLDAELAWRLDLHADVRRLPLTFMGCAAGATALRLASGIVRTEPSARVLIVTVELCSLHIQPDFERENLLSAAFFGDGASACVVAKEPHRREGTFVLHDASAVLLPDSADHMSWTIGNYGFRLRLSPDIPRLMASAVPTAFRAFWGEDARPELWAIHPGGRAIVDSLQSALRLTDSQTEASRSVLRQYGNMSSATILFVLDELRRSPIRTANAGVSGIAVAFGPGVTAEMLRFDYRPW